MASVADKIMNRVSDQPTGWVCTPKDFVDLGSRQAVDQALSRLVKAGKLRRVSRGLYDKPRFSKNFKSSRTNQFELRDRRGGEAGRYPDVAGRLYGCEPGGSYEFGSGKNWPCNRRSFKNAQNRRTNRSIPTCGAECHAVGGETVSSGGAGTEVVRSENSRRS